MEVSSLPRPGSRMALRPSRRILASLSDERLVDAARRGNQAAFEVIYDRHHRGILAFCRHMLGSADEAEDAVQHTFISAYPDLFEGTRELKLKAWLYTIARNRCLSILRARREQAAELPEIATAGLSDDVMRRDDLRRLLADVQRLPDDQRAALVLSELGDLSHAEIASIVGCEPMKVKSLVFQARSSLIESRRASEIPCHEIREQLATASGGALRRGPLRRHLRGCPGGTEFRDEVRHQRQMLALALPVIPSAGLKSGVLAAAGLGPGSGGGLAAGGALAGGATSSAGAVTAGGGSVTLGAGSAAGAGAGGSVLSGIGAAGAAKVAVVAIVAAGGGVAVERVATVDRPGHGHSGAVHDGATPAAGGAAGTAGRVAPGAAKDAPGGARSAAAHDAQARENGKGGGKSKSAAKKHHGGGSSSASHGRGASHSAGHHGHGSSGTGSSHYTPPDSSGTTYTPPPAAQGPPATHPVHPVHPPHPSHGNSAGSNGRHLGNGASG